MTGGAGELTIDELADRAGVSVRTVRYYITQGLLAGPGTRGRAAAYGDEHLARLRLIRRLVEQHVPLGELRQRLEGLSATDVQSLLGDEERHGRALQRAEVTQSPRDYVAGLLARAKATRVVAPAPAPSAAPPVALQAQPKPADARLLAEDWKTWRLAAGIELHVRADVARDRPRLIERLLETAREAPGGTPGSDAAFTPGG